MRDELDTLLAELVSGDDERAEQAAARVAALGRDALPEVLALLDSTDWNARWWAVRTLAQMDEPPMDLLVSLAGDASEEVRQCAILALVYHPDGQAIPVLLQGLIDPEPVTVNLAASALIEIGTPAVPALHDLPVNAPHLSRVEAMRALAHIADPRSIPIFMKAMEEDSPALQYWAEQGLEKLGVGMVYMKPQ